MIHPVQSQHPNRSANLTRPPLVVVVVALVLATLSLATLTLATHAEEATEEATTQAPNATGAPVATTAESFAACLTRLQAEARAAQVPESVIKPVFANIKHLDRVVASDRSQPEFVTTFSEYFAARVNNQRVQQGRDLLQSEHKLLRQIQIRTGVPPHYLVALWGLETNFGSYFGKLSIPSALATLACDSRRASFFSAQLIATLNIISAGDMSEDQLIGSWAGAIGHMQFMPTTFLEHAVDGDNDGRRNLMTRADALSSGGAYLQNLGWDSDYRWGREVLLPKSFDYAKTGTDQWRPLSEWRAAGLRNAFGKPLGSAPIEAAVILPAGHSGPVFLVYPNYKNILAWNRSHFYALSVGRLADRIAGAAPLQTPLPPVATIKLSRVKIEQLQRRLNELGFPAGKPDGVFGSGTSKAVRLAQAQLGQRADGYPNEQLYTALFTERAEPRTRNPKK